MKNHIIPCLIALLLAFLPTQRITVMAQSVTEEEKARILARINEANAPDSTLRICFTQEKRSALLSEPLVGKGVLCFEAPAKIRLENDSEVKTLFILNGTKVKTQSGSEKAKFTDISANKRYKTIARSFSQASSAPPKFEDAFEVTVSVSEDWVLDLRPRRNDLKQLFSSVIVCADPKTGRIKSAVLTDTNGDTTTFSIQSFQSGCAINPDLFKIE